MKFRIVDAAILLATIVGAGMAFSTARELHGLQAEYARLTELTGEMAITDPAQLHVQAIPTGEPLHFAWRVYAPAGQIALFESSGSGGQGSSTQSNSQPREFVARIRFADYRANHTTLFSTVGNSSGFWTFGSAEIYRFLLEHQHELDIEQLGASELARVKPGQSATLLRIRIPESLAEEVRQKSSDPQLQRLLPDVFQCRLELKP